MRYTWYVLYSVAHNSLIFAKMKSIGVILETHYDFLELGTEKNCSP